MNDRRILASKAALGFGYVLFVQHRDGSISQRERVHNLIPDEGLNHIMGVAFKQSTQVSTWYLALYEGNYTPTHDLTAATFPALATECVAYEEGARVQFVPGSLSAGALDNSASPAIFTFTAQKTVYGGVMTSSSPFGSTTGVIPSAVRFASPKQLQPGDILKVVAGNSLVSA